MSEYTKEQEAEAIEFMAREFSDWTSAAIVTAMAKRTEAAEARVAELERALSEADNDRDALRDMVRETPAPLVIVTRELLEMMLADAETRAVYGRGDMPLNPAARLVVALRKMLEGGR